MPFHRVWILGFAVAASAVLAGAPAPAQSCYTGSSPMNDICGTGITDTDYTSYGTFRSATVNYNGVSYVFDIHYNSVDVWDATVPTSPVLLTGRGVSIPWVVSGEGSGFYLTPHIRHVATLDGFPYALASLYKAGWDFFRVDTQQFLHNGYNPGSSLKNYYYLNSATPFFRATSGDVYVVGQKLDGQAINDNDASVYLYLVQNATITPATLTYQSMSQHRYRIPIGGANDGAYSSFGLGSGGTLRFHTFTAGGSPYLLIRSAVQAVVLNVSNPQSIPLPVAAMWTSAIDSDLFAGNWAVDTVHAMLHVADDSTEKVYSYDISDPVRPSLVATTTWHSPVYVAQSRPLTVIATGGGSVVVVGCGQYLGYIPIDKDGKLVPPALPEDTTGAQATYIDPLQCVHPTLRPGVMDLRVFTAPSGQACVARALYSWADVIVLSGSCLSTAPAPAFTATSNSAGAPATCPASPTSPSTAVIAKGFPGDTFTITDNSLGTVASGTLVLNRADAPTQPIMNWLETGSDAWTPQPLAWASPENQAPGEYQLTMTLNDQTTSYPLTQSIVLCDNPLADVEITAVNGVACSGASCTYLTTDTVRFSAAPPISQGSPTSYFWFVNEALQQGNLPTFELTLAQAQTYNVAVAVRYGFDGSTASSCSLLAVPSSPEYTTCASLPAITAQPFSIGAIGLSQTPQPPDAQYLISKSISLSAPYKLGAGYTATFGWALDAPDTIVAAFNPTPATITAGVSSISGNVTGTIPANYFTVAGSHTVYLVAWADKDGTHVQPTPPQVTFNVVDCQPPGNITSVSPADGSSQSEGSVTFSWQPPPGSPTLTYIVERQLLPNTWGSIPGCNGITSTTCTTTLSANLYQWRVKSSNACGTSTSGPWTLTLTSVGPQPSYKPSASFSFSPGSPQIGQQIQFTDQSSNMSSSYAPLSWSWDFGDGMPPLVPPHTSTSQNPTFTYDKAKTYAITLTVTNSYGSSTTSRQVTVSAPCTATAAPTASFTYASPARVGVPVQFMDTSTGGPTSWAWDFGDGTPPIIGAHTSSAQNPTNTFASTGTYTVKLTASNCKGSTPTQQQVVVVSACDQTVPPVANFTVGPTGAYPDYPQQQQPFVGQPVTLTDASTGSPSSWQWYDFQELMIPPTTVTTPTFTVTWTQPGDKNVRMTATNCVGRSAEVLKIVHVYDDIRPVIADFSWSPTDVATGAPVTFTAAQGMSYGGPTDFTWTFDDGSTQTGASVTYTFKCGGARGVALTAARGSASGRASKAVSVTGESCGPESVMAVDAARVNGQNGTSWRTDIRIFNPADHPSSIWLEFLPVGQNNITPFKAGPYLIAAKATLVVNNILDFVSTNLGVTFQKTALRVTYQNDANMAPVVIARTYTPSPTGGSFGQFAPGIAVVPNSTPSPLWITGLRNNGLADGFRTNYSLVNLRDDSGGVGDIKFTLFDWTGAQQATATVGLAPFGYLQDSVTKLFGGKFDDIGNFSLRVDVPQGSDIQAYASVMDNHTGDPVLIPAVPPADSPVYLPAVAHLNGEAGTVWRTDLQFTNPDPNGAHTWELRFTPKGASLPIVTRNVTLAPNQSGFTDDLIAWIYGDALPADATTSGVVRIEMAPNDTSNVFPIMAARSYNLTPNGTFGQSIVPLWAARGVSADSASKRLLITGISSEDISRTNLGLVNLSETQGVNFSIVFYDKNGALLNPQDAGSPTPFTFALGPGGWDQDKLENRFRNAFKVNLPPNLDCISAVITVTDGGPGFVYATVIDNQTGDPNFIPAQPVP